MRALIIEGNPRIRARLAERLAPHGVAVLDAQDLPTAMEALATLVPDAILVDVHLDARTGRDAVSRLRRAAPNALLVVLTNEASDVHRAECMRHGADQFFDKSKDFDRAVELVLERMTRRP